MSDSFGARLRGERERKRIGLAAIAHSTKISIGLLEALERDDASRWPSGIFRRAFIRAYADAIGLDREAILREFLDRFPDPAGDPQTSAPGNERRGATSHDSPAADAGPLRLALADEASPFGSAPLRVLRGWSQRALAAVYDLAIVVGIAAVVFALAGQFWTPFAVATTCYYFGGVLALGNSPCGWLVARGRKATARDRRLGRIHLLPTARTVDEPGNLAEFRLRRYTKAV